MNEKQRSYFNHFADEYDSVYRPWAKKYETEQRKNYGIDTQHAVIASNKVSLAANLEHDYFVKDSFGQIIAASNELARLQDLGDKERAELQVNNVNDAITFALQTKIDAEDWEEAARLYKRNGHLLTTANQDTIKNNIRSLLSRTQAKKAFEDASGKLLQMDEETAAAHLGDRTWLQSMNISEEKLPELKEYNSTQRQKALREKKQSENIQEFTWFDKVITASLKDPIAGLRIVQERKDIEPELRNSILDAIQNGRIDTNDDAATIFALQDRIFGDDPDIENGEFAREIGKGNLRIDSFKALAEMQKNLNKGEKNLVRNALHILDSSFDSSEDYGQNPNRLAARNMYLKSLTKAIANNDTGQLVQLTNKEHVQSVGQSFSAINALNQHTADAQNNPQGGNFLQKLVNGFYNYRASSNTQHATERQIVERLKGENKINDEYHEYTDDAFSAVQKAKNDIRLAAKAYGIPAMSIAGAIVDEYSAQEVWKRGFGAFDGIQDWYAKNSILEEVRKNYAKKGEGQSILSKNSAKHDIGPGNFGVRTALELFEKNIIQDKGNNPIKSFLYKDNASLANATDQEKWEAYIENMVLTTEGTAWLAAAEIQKGLIALNDKKAMDGLSDIEKAGVLMTWYKQGEEYLVRYLERPSNDVRPIGVGEGRGLFHYYDKFKEILK